jgi:OOP family OmpA-OmpF porin
MTRRILTATIVCGVILTGLIATDVQAFEVLTKDDFVQKIVVKKHLIKMADNAIILFDASGSMKDPYLDTDMTRYEVAKQTLKERNTYLPDLGYNLGLYVYNRWSPIYPVQPYDREKFGQAIDSLPEPGGPTMLQSGLRKLEPVLKELSGRTVVFLFTDGTYTETAGTSPKAIARNLAGKYDVCFYVISTADDEASRKVVEGVASVDFCSRAIPFEAFVNRPEYNAGALYLVKATVGLKTITETKIAGVKVDDILFDLDKAKILPAAERELTVLSEYLQENPDAYVVLAGYTCNMGREEYNLGLSHKRAEIVTEYLKNNFNISPDRVLSLWYGQMNPVADNSTEEGRRLNRRVEIAVGGVK